MLRTRTDQTLERPDGSHVRALCLVLARIAALPFTFYAAGLLVVLLAANLVSVALQGNAYELQIGFRADRHFVSGFLDQEEDQAGTRYRWTQERSVLRIDDFVAVEQPFLTLAIGGIPPTAVSPRLVQLQADDQPWFALPVTAEPRRYRMLLPPRVLLDGTLHLTLSSATSRVPPDRRDIGIRLDQAVIGWSSQAWVRPTWTTLLVQWGIVVAALVASWRLSLGRHRRGTARYAPFAIAAGLIVLLAWMTGYDPFVAARWQYRLLVASLGLLLVILGIFPRLVRLLPQHASKAPRKKPVDLLPVVARYSELRWLVVLTAVAMGIRLLGALYPTFDAHDWYIHEERLLKLQYGEMLLFDKPAEFSKQIAIVPSAPYVMVTPLTLFTTDTVPTTQGLYTFLDGCALFLLALFVRQIGGSMRAAQLALLILAALPIQFTALWWGFGPQIIGQALLLALLVFVAQRRISSRMLWVVAVALCSMMLLVHNGVALLGGGWMAGYVALVFVMQRQERLHWQGWGSVLLLSALIAVILLYSDVIALQLRGVSANKRLAFTEQDIFRVKYTLGSLCMSFRPLSVPCDQFVAGNAIASVLPQTGMTLISSVLPLLSLGMLIFRTRGLHRWLVLAWLASAGLFLAVDLAFGLQVRYAYFLVPMVCVGLALLLDDLMARHRWGGVMAACLIGLIVVTGIPLWYNGVMWAIKPSLRLLTH